MDVQAHHAWTRLAAISNIPSGHGRIGTVACVTVAAVGASSSPKFDRPPVTEVAIAVEFVPIPALSVVKLVQLHDALWATRYPKLVEQPPIPPGDPEPGSVLAGIGLSISPGVAPLRLWMLAEDEAELLQLQHDRLILNWRRLGDGAYPSYEALRATFSVLWQDFVGAMADVADVRPTIAEVTFVNTVPVTPGWSALSQVIASAGVPAIRGECLSSSVQYVSSLDAGVGGPGRIVATANSMNADALNLTIVTRLGAGGDSLQTSAILDRLDVAHDLAVETFVSLTPPEKHNEWGRTQ